MAKYLGSSGARHLFSSGDRAVLVDSEIDVVVASGYVNSLYNAQVYKRGGHPSSATIEMANIALESLVPKIGNSKLYTVPNSVQKEVQKGLLQYTDELSPAKARISGLLASGAQVPLDEIVYVNTKLATLKSAGETSGATWAIYGGDVADRWTGKIVESEQAKALIATGYFAGDKPFVPHDYDADVMGFDVDQDLDDEEPVTEFLARVRLDGSGIDRLYRVEPDGTTHVWDDGSWDTAGQPNGDIWTIDLALDHDVDDSEFEHVLIDAESAIVVSALLQQSPNRPVSIAEIDAAEAEIAAEAGADDDEDWDVVDYVVRAAGYDATPGVYDPNERSQNASKQVRDKNGKFAQVGSKVVIGGDPDKGAGSIVGLDPATQQIKVKLDTSGETVSVPAKSVEDAEKFRAAVPGTPIQPTAVDLSGILGEPRKPINQPLAIIPGTLPKFSREQIHGLIHDWPSFVTKMRQGYTGKAGTPKSPVKAKDSTDGAPQGLTIDAYEHPLISKWLNKRSDQGDWPNKKWYNPVFAAEDGGTAMSPDKSDVKPVYMAVVDPDDPRAVLKLIALVPKSSTQTAPTTYSREDGEWVADPSALAALQSATPPPVVPLEGESLDDVLVQVDNTQETGIQPEEEESKVTPAVPTPDAQPIADSAKSEPTQAPTNAPGVQPVAASAALTLDHAITVLYRTKPRKLVEAIVAAGGMDRNAGGAEKLRRYWTWGQGAAKIRWGTGGDWKRCVRHLSKYLGPRAKGYCALRHKEMTGLWTGDKRHRRTYGKELYSMSTEQGVLEQAMLQAELADISDRVKGLTAGATVYENLPEVDILPEASTGQGGARFRIPLIIPEGVDAGDPRFIKKGALSHRDLPLPLLWQIKTAQGHDGSVVVGRIDHMERTPEGYGNAYGVFDTGAYGREAERMVRERFLKGVSADMDRFEAADEQVIEASEDGSETKTEKTVISKARIMAVTIVPKPAFQEAQIFLEEEASTEEEEVIPDGIYVDDVDPAEASTLVACGLIAGAIPVVPPTEWFYNPGLNKRTPLTIEDDGRVFGHIATWEMDHIAYQSQTRPPRSRSNYAYFNTGLVRTSDGSDQTVGQLTLAGGHAGLEADAMAAARHYDDTGSAVADVHAGEDEYGIWVAGALRPGTTPEQIRVLRASVPSGDWRPIKNRLELVAICQVNVPGFPIARAMVSSGHITALVAAGTATLARMKSDPIAEMAARVESLEQAQKKELAQLAAAAQARINVARDERNAELAQKAQSLSARFAEASSFSFVPKSERDALAKKGAALPDGSFPIRNEADLKNAIKAYGRASDKEAAKAHIKKRARALGLTDLLPEEWTQKASAAITASITDLRARAEFASKKIDKERLEELERIARQRGINVGSPSEKAPKAVPADQTRTDNGGEVPDTDGPPGGVKPEEKGKYTPKTQPRDADGRFRLVLARLKENLGVSGNQEVLAKLKETENLVGHTGNYTKAASSAVDLLGLIDRLDSGALNKESLENVRATTRELGETIANLPLPFDNQTEKIRYSDMPPALRALADKLIQKVTEKIGAKEGAAATADIRAFRSGSKVYSQSDISSQMNRLLRLLT